MFRFLSSRTFGIVFLVSIGIVAVSGQAASPVPPAGQAPTDPLLAEVKALRAEISQVAGASMRMQFLVARLQLQEQRINTVARQITEVQTHLAGLAPGLAMFAAQMKQAAQDRIEPDDFVKATVGQMQKRERELKEQETSLSAQLASEQLRWIEFNNRLDELERTLPAR